MAVGAVHLKGSALNELGYKIFLDRYALKDVARTTLTVGDTVIVVVDSQTGQREIGEITALELPRVTVRLLNKSVVERDIENVDKPLETDPATMMDRVAAGVAAAESTPELQQLWQERFRDALEDWKFVPAGRILTAAGTDQELTWYNCYVVPSPKDTREGIMLTLSQMTEIMSRGGGVGINIASLRPRHSYVRGVNGRSSGAVSWGALYSFVTGLIEQGGSRRGALMLILNDWHPDILDFIASKRQAGHITNANISVGISDRFMTAVREDADWELLFPDTSTEGYDELWDGDLEAWQAAGRQGAALSHREGARNLGCHHRERLGQRRAGGLVPRAHRVHVQQPQFRQPRVYQPLRRAEFAGLGRVQSGGHQPGEVLRP